VAKIKYIEANGAEHIVDVAAGYSVMEGAVRHSIPGILGDCGGSCACGTCRVSVDEAWRSRVGSASELEEETLDIHNDPVPGRRLSCQIKVTEGLDGLTVRMPDKQF
jgi:2Fe-2S ferredoxin